MRRRTFMLSLLTLCGCRAPQTEQGEFAQFFVREVRARGGRTLPVDHLPAIPGRWRIDRDQFGFTVHLRGADFPAVDSFMSQVLGEPEITTPRNVDGNPQRMYEGQISGMHIQMIGKPTEIFIVAVGPKKAAHDHSIQRTEASRFAQLQSGHRWRLASAADAGRSPHKDRLDPRQP